MSDGTSPDRTPTLQVTDLCYDSRDFHLGPISLEVAPGEFVSVIGPNGAGKSTFLRLLSGLEAPTSGKIQLRGRDVSGLAPHRRNVGFVFQDLALFPHMTVEQNIGYALRVQDWAPGRMAERIRELLEVFHLRPYAERLPRELSGGERQRVAVARSLAPRPDILLLDEPLSSIDPEKRRWFQSELKVMLEQQGTTVLHVTHDLEEGAYLSDRMAVMMMGQVVQIGDSEEVLRHPVNTQVARFLGYNVWREGIRWKASLPSALQLEPESGTGELRGTVVSLGRTLGAELVTVEVEGPELLRIERPVAVSGLTPLKPGAAVRVRTLQCIDLAD